MRGLPAQGESWLSDPASLFSVRGKVAIVTGASGAFGALAAQVWRVPAPSWCWRPASRRSSTRSCLPARLSGRKRSASTSGRIPRPIAAIVAEAVSHFGSLDILVVTSGMNDVAPIVEMSPERFETVMQANVTGSWLMARAAGQQMINQGRGGKVVLTSSARGKLGHPAGYSAYCASKAAVDGITKALGCEWGKYGITVNAIAPTVFRSALTAWMFEDTEKGTATRQGMLARIPIGRLGEPSDLAGPLLFLSSAASNFYTGHVLYADGGYTAG